MKRAIVVEGGAMRGRQLRERERPGLAGQLHGVPGGPRVSGGGDGAGSLQPWNVAAGARQSGVQRLCCG